MEKYSIKKVFESQLGTGFAALALSFIVASLIWPLWSLATEAIYLKIAGAGISSVDSEITGRLTGLVAEGSFFWMIINAWIWLALVMGTYGKTYLSTNQPWAGIWYTLVAWLA